MASEVQIVVSAKDQATGVLRGVGSALGGIARAAAAMGTAFVAVAGYSIKTAIEVESAWTGIVKTTDGLVDALGNITPVGEQIRQEFRNLAKEIPMALEDLMKIGELAGQLGVPKEALAGFTETIAALGVSTNLTTEQAATALARIQNIYAVTADDMAENTQRMGSSIVGLGNNFATTEADIVTFAERIAGAGVIAGLTQADIFGISAALSSVGVQAEAGGTATQKVLLAINEAVVTGSEDLQIFAETAGLSAQEFASAWEVDAGGAFESFVLGLGQEGDNAIGILSDLGLEDQRLIRSFLSLAGAGDLITRTMEESSKAWKENTALTEEAARRYATTESRLAILKNIFKDVALSIGDFFLPAINNVLGKFSEFGIRIGKAVSLFTELKETGVPTFEALSTAAKDIFNIDISGLEGIWSKIETGDISGLFVDFTAAFRNAIQSVDWQTLSRDLAAKIDAVDWSVAGNALTTSIGNVLQGIGTIIGETDWGALLGSVTQGLAEFIAGMFGTTFEQVRAQADAFWFELGMKFAVGVLKIQSAFLGASAVIKGIWQSIKGTILGVLNTIVGNAIGGINKIKGAFLGIIGAIAAVIAKLKALAAAFANLIIPAWLTPGSPTPFEIGLLGINDALKKLNATVPNFGMLNAPTVSAGVGGGGAAIVNLTYAPTISTASARELQDVLMPFIQHGINQSRRQA